MGVPRGIKAVFTWLMQFPLSLVFAIYAGYGGLAVVDGTLARMHPPGGASASAGDILSPSSIGNSQAHFVAIRQWFEWEAAFNSARVAAKGGQVLSPVGLLGTYLVVDLLLIALPVALLLWKANWFARDRIETTTAQDRASTVNSVLDMAFYLTLVFLIVDVVEDASLLVFVWTGSPWVGGLVLIGLISATKLVVLAMTIITLGIGLWSGLRLPQPSESEFSTRLKEGWQVVLALRVHIAVAAFLLVLAGLQGDLGRQLDDAYLLLFDPWWRLFVTVAVALLLTFALRKTGRLCLRAYIETPAEPPNKGQINGRILIGGVIAILLGAAAVLLGWPVGQALLAPGVIVVVLAVLSFNDVDKAATIGPVEMPKVAAPEEKQAVQGRLLASALATAPLAVLVALSLRNGIRLLTVRDVGGAFWIAVVLMALAVTAALIAYRWTDLQPSEPSRRWLPVLAASSILLFVVLGLSPQITGTSLAPWGVVFALALAAALGLTALLLLGDSIYPGNVLRACGLRRLPVIAIVFASILGSSLVDDQSVYHATRLLTAGTASPRDLLPLDQALDAWAAKQPNKPEIPLVFVASSGGGIRAAYWTTLVLGCLIKESVKDGEEYRKPAQLADDTQCRDAAMPMDAIFLASGISGGSLGLAVAQSIDDRNNWSEPLRRDFLGPAAAALAFRDIPNSLARINVHDQDRAAALERAWENAVRQGGGNLDAGLMATARPDGAGPEFPLLALNGTSVTDGCRLAVSALKLGTRPGQSQRGDAVAKTTTRDCLALNPLLSKGTDSFLQSLAGTKDAFDNTCREKQTGDPQDLRLSTAALLSARFPYVSPTGTLNSCQNSRDRTFDLDGGLIDSSGASPLALSWPEVVNWLDTHSGGRCFAPKLILVENGYLSQTQANPPARPGELTAPLTATGAVRDAQSPAARQAAALTFERSFPPGGCGKTPQNADGWVMPNVVDFYPVARPGVEAPLGWTLSKYSQDSLEQQLGNSDNLCSAAIVNAWFTGQTERPPACY